MRSSAGQSSMMASDGQTVDRATMPRRQTETTTSIVFIGCAIADGFDLLPARLELQRRSLLAWPPGLASFASPTLSLSRAPALGKIGGQAARPISTGKLHALPHFHIRPINHVVYVGSSGALRLGTPNLEGGFPLRCFQRLSRPNIATRRCHWRDNRNTIGSSNSVLSY